MSARSGLLGSLENLMEFVSVQKIPAGDVSIGDIVFDYIPAVRAPWVVLSTEKLTDIIIFHVLQSGSVHKFVYRSRWSLWRLS